MDYGKSGVANMAKKGPKHHEHNQYGSDKTPFGQRPSKAELLERMKKAQTGQETDAADKADKAD